MTREQNLGEFYKSPIFRESVFDKDTPSYLLSKIKYDKHYHYDTALSSIHTLAYRVDDYLGIKPIDADGDECILVDIPRAINNLMKDSMKKDAIIKNYEDRLVELEKRMKAAEESILYIPGGDEMKKAKRDFEELSVKKL